MEPRVSFSEFIEEVGTQWTDALRIYAKVLSPIEERPREEWEHIFLEMTNMPIKN